MCGYMHFTRARARYFSFKGSINASKYMKQCTKHFEALPWQYTKTQNHNGGFRDHYTMSFN